MYRVAKNVHTHCIKICIYDFEFSKKTVTVWIKTLVQNFLDSVFGGFEGMFSPSLAIFAP